MKVKTPDTTIISQKKVEFPDQCSTYIMEKCTFRFSKETQNASLSLETDYFDDAPCTYDTGARKITAGARGQNITATLDYWMINDNNETTVGFSLLLPNQKMKPSNEDYITFTQDLTDNNVRVCFKNTTGEAKLQDTTGLPEINFQLNHEYELWFSKENYFFIINDTTAECQLYSSIDRHEVTLSGDNTPPDSLYGD